MMEIREIRVPGIEIGIPVIGFGCSSLTSVGPKNALRLLECAFDVGVRHFDVARYYGFGETEGILGDFIKSRRSQVTVTTKFGIDPPRRTSILRIGLGLGRRFLRIVPSARRALQQRASVLVKGNAFSVADAQRNLETSLRELKSDYIDFYLLHDYVSGERAVGELTAFFRQAIDAGKIRYFGLGTSIESVLRALDSEPELCGVIQFQNSVLTRNLAKLPPRVPHGLVITHGALAGGFRVLSLFLNENKGGAKKWSAELDLDCSDKAMLAGLLLNYAVRANAGGLVLFSARSTERIRKNAKSILEPCVTPAQVTLFSELVERNLQTISRYS
jgi:aryl-alcohol dehydrogenase-like predicted oxidoreductase